MKLFIVLIAVIQATQQSPTSNALVPEQCHKEYPTGTYTPGDELTTNQKCLIKCALEFDGVMNNKGELNVTRGKELSHMYSPTDMIAKYDSMFSTCRDKSYKQEDKCERAYVYMFCFGEEAMDLLL